MIKQDHKIAKILDRRLAARNTPEGMCRGHFNTLNTKVGSSAGIRYVSHLLVMSTKEPQMLSVHRSSWLHIISITTKLCSQRLTIQGYCPRVNEIYEGMKRKQGYLEEDFWSMHHVHFQPIGI